MRPFPRNPPLGYTQPGPYTLGYSQQCESLCVENNLDLVCEPLGCTLFGSFSLPLPLTLRACALECGSLGLIVESLRCLPLGWSWNLSPWVENNRLLGSTQSWSPCLGPLPTSSYSPPLLRAALALSFQCKCTREPKYSCTPAPLLSAWTFGHRCAAGMPA